MLATGAGAAHCVSMRHLPALLLAFLIIPAAAQEPPLPRERPQASEPDAPQPQPRAEAEEEAEPEEAEDEAEEAEEVEEEAEAPEELKPPRIYQVACPAVLSGLVEAEALPPLSEGACGARSPLAVTGVLVNGRMVPLSAPATLNCEMATALPDWAAAVDGYLWAKENTRIARLLTGTSYMCRGRNRVVGADTSEHGFANALDLTGFELEDGRSVTLPEGWAAPRSAAGRLLRFAHDAGCARFTTTLGPEANAQHADHLHFDMGCHGEACTARLCE
jgi:hypothetical protein